MPLNLVAGYLLAVLDLALDAVLNALALHLTIMMPTFLNHRVALRQAPGAAQHLLGSDGLVSTDFPCSVATIPPLILLLLLNLILHLLLLVYSETFRMCYVTIMVLEVLEGPVLLLLDVLIRCLMWHRRINIGVFLIFCSLALLGSLVESMIALCGRLSTQTAI